MQELHHTRNMPLYKGAQFAAVLHINGTLNTVPFMQGCFYGNWKRFLGSEMSLLHVPIVVILLFSFPYWNRQCVPVGTGDGDDLAAWNLFPCIRPYRGAPALPVCFWENCTIFGGEWDPKPCHPTVTSHAFGGSAAPHSSSVSEPSPPAGDPQPSSHRCGCRNASTLWVRGVIFGCCARGGPAAQGLAGGSLFGAIPQV